MLVMGCCVGYRANATLNGRVRWELFFSSLFGMLHGRKAKYTRKEVSFIAWMSDEIWLFFFSLFRQDFDVSANGFVETLDWGKLNEMREEIY